MSKHEGRKSTTPAPGSEEWRWRWAPRLTSVAPGFRCGRRFSRRCWPGRWNSSGWWRWRWCWRWSRWHWLPSGSRWPYTPSPPATSPHAAWRARPEGRDSKPPGDRRKPGSLQTHYLKHKHTQTEFKYKALVMALKWIVLLHSDHDVRITKNSKLQTD